VITDRQEGGRVAASGGAAECATGRLPLDFVQAAGRNAAEATDLRLSLIADELNASHRTAIVTYRSMFWLARQRMSF